MSEREHIDTTPEEFQIARDKDGNWEVYDFEWDARLFCLPSSLFTEEQVRIVCSVVYRRSKVDFEAGEQWGRISLQNDLARLLNVQTAGTTHD